MTNPVECYDCEANRARFVCDKCAARFCGDCMDTHNADVCDPRDWDTWEPKPWAEDRLNP